MPSPTPEAVVHELRGYGLDVSVGAGGHWKVRDPKSGAWLFDISRSPSDHNWYWGLRRHLRRIGVIKKEISELGQGKGRKQKSGGFGGSKKPLIDLDALKIAQDRAAAAGEHIPQLEDLDNTTEFFNRNKLANNVTVFTEEGVEEAIDIMVAKADTPRLHATKQRFYRFFEEHENALAEKARTRNIERYGSARGVQKGKGARTEFVRIAIEEVAPSRGLRAWKSISSGQQTLNVLFRDPDAGMELWTCNLLEATMDHIEGMKWGVYAPETPQGVEENGDEPTAIAVTMKPSEAEKIEDVAVPTVDEPEDTGGFVGAFAPPEPTPVMEDEPEPEVHELELQVSVVDKTTLQHRYANVLLGMLESGTFGGDGFDLQLILKRLDKLVGIEVK